MIDNIIDILHAYKYNKITETEAVKGLLCLHSVMSCCIDFNNYCSSKYISKINGKYFKSEYDIDYGEGATEGEVYRDFLCTKSITTPR
jgi:hypothetical protein